MSQQANISGGVSEAFRYVYRNNKFDSWEKSLFFFLKRFPGAKKNRTYWKSSSDNTFIANYFILILPYVTAFHQVLRLLAHALL